MQKIVKQKKIRILANHMLSLSDFNSFPIHMNMEFNAEALLKYKKENQFSLTALITKNIAYVLKAENKFEILNSYLLKSPLAKGRLVIFKDISFSIALPKVYDGEDVATLYILKELNKKTICEIDLELRQASLMKIEEMPFFKKMHILLKIPSFFYPLLFTFLKWFPSPKLVAGSSLGLTNLGKSPVQSVFPVSPKTLIFGLGGTYNKVVTSPEGFSELRHMTLSLTFNHYVVDGLICSDFLNALKIKLENIK